MYTKVLQGLVSTDHPSKCFHLEENLKVVIQVCHGGPDTPQGRFSYPGEASRYMTITIYSHEAMDKMSVYATLIHELSHLYDNGVNNGQYLAEGTTSIYTEQATVLFTNKFIVVKRGFDIIKGGYNENCEIIYNDDSGGKEPHEGCTKVD